MGRRSFTSLAMKRRCSVATGPPIPIRAEDRARTRSLHEARPRPRRLVAHGVHVVRRYGGHRPVQASAMPCASMAARSTSTESFIRRSRRVPARVPPGEWGGRADDPAFEPWSVGATVRDAVACSVQSAHRVRSAGRLSRCDTTAAPLPTVESRTVGAGAGAVRRCTAAPLPTAGGVRNRRSRCACPAA